MDVRQHLREVHRWTDRDFTLFGDAPQDQAMYMEGAHDQEHEHLAAHSDHDHEEDKDGSS